MRGRRRDRRRRRGIKKEGKDFEAEIKRLKMEARECEEVIRALEEAKKERDGTHRYHEEEGINKEKEEEYRYHGEEGTLRVIKKEGKEKGIILPRLKGEEITEEVMRRFVQKCKEKMKDEKDIRKLLREMLSALVGRASDIYYVYFNEGGKVEKEEDLEELF